MTPKRIALIIAAVILFALGFSAWLRQHDANVALKASTAQIEKERSKAKEQTVAEVKAIEKEKAAIKTPDQAVQIVNRYIPLPVPLHIDLPPAQASGSLEQKLDAPIPQPIVLPAEDVIPLAKYAEDCRECKVKLAAEVADNERLSRELGEAQTAAKGGSWIKRAGRNTKIILCSGAGAAAGSGQGAKGAAAGAIAGALACSLF